ncbi:polysaccharide biosynthesis tyrosine autokinase [Streptomyces sp. NPDC059009]|uniref:polysaccharide biosynthesis tyrosine autokinase n=1 Tax=Streptomyces sp. NPDC059009 TaxID=3346694 RepID=UPI0036A560CC
MDLRGFLKVLARRWRLSALCLLLGIAGAQTATALSTPEYEARTQLFVATRAGAGSTELNQGQSFSQARVQSYAAIVATQQVTRPVVQRLHLPTTPEELATRVTAEAPPNTVLINIAVRDTDPRRAAATANAVATRFSSVVESLETPRQAPAAEPGMPAPAGPPVSPVSLGTTERATTPQEPVSPKALLNLAAGVLAGLLLGAGLVVLRETLDTTLKSGEALGALTDLPVLGAIPYDKDAPQQPFAGAGGGHSARAEAFRRLRTNLQFAQVDDRPRVIAVTSSLPGEGKTSTAGNLALSLAAAGVATCLVDADLRKPRVARTFGLVQDAGLTTVLIGRAGVEDVVQQAPHGLAVLASGAVPPNPTELLASERMRDVLRQLAERYEVVIVDTAPLLPVADTVGLARLADGALLVVRAAKTTRDQVRGAAESLGRVGVRTLGTVLSMAALPKDSGYGSYGDLPAPRPPATRHLSPPAPALSYLAGDK